MTTKNNLLIYVVEDNKIYNRLVCEYLKKQNYSNVKSFLSGKECIKQVLKGEHPDIVIQDYHLGDSTGIDVLKNVKKHNKKSEFIFLTANESMEVAVNTIKYGAYDYIVKDNDLALKKVVFKMEKIFREITRQKKDEIIKQVMVISIIVLIIIVIFAILHIVFNAFGIAK
jgi:DNA-binding NtrC family response regulator